MLTLDLQTLGFSEIATHSSVLAGRIPGTAEPGGLPSMGLHRVGHDLAAAAVAVGMLYFYLLNQANLFILKILKSKIPFN